jgi:hypothetical protein
VVLEPLRPTRGGFLRPFGCGRFIRDFLLGKAPHGSTKIDPDIGAPQTDICFQYKTALLKATALDRATRAEEKRARREKRSIDPENIERLAECLTKPEAAGTIHSSSISATLYGSAGLRKPGR